ncbi:MAG: ATP synthase subunit I [Gammaproteobacteria bacterium]|nr:ATP synthase subunit I [Gammaproteobacteria bacterium]
MRAITDSLQRDILRVLVAQAILVLIVVLVVMAIAGIGAVFSVIYGGSVTLAGTWWMGRRVAQAAELARDNSAGSALAVYGGAIQRFIFVLVALAIGMGALKLAPLPLLAGFVISQAGYLAAVFSKG